MESRQTWFLSELTGKCDWKVLNYSKIWLNLHEIVHNCIFLSRFEKSKQGCFWLRCYGPKWPRRWILSCRLECRSQQPVPVVWELVQYLHYSLALEKKCAWTDCDEGFRQAGDSSISHCLAGLVGVRRRGGGFAPSLHGKPLDVYPLQLISHSQQIRHIRCCFGHGHQSS